MAKNDHRVTYILKIIIKICMKNVEFCRKTSIYVFTQAMSVHFLYFSLNEKELNQQVCLIKYVKNEIPNFTSQKKERTFLKLLKNFHTSYTLVANYHKLSLSPLVVRL